MTAISVLGGTSATGHHLLGLLSQRPDTKLTLLFRGTEPPTGLLAARWVHGDATDPGAVTDAVAGADVVLTLVAARRQEPPGRVRSDATRAVLDAIDRVAPGAHLVAVSALGGQASRDQQTAPARLLYPRVVGAERLAEVDRQEALVAEWGGPATVVRPPKLDDRTATGYREATGPLGLSATLHRADLARYLADTAAGLRPTGTHFATVVSA